jgi:hypothetical protein
MLVASGCSISGAVRDGAGLTLPAIAADSDLRRDCEHPDPTLDRSWENVAGEYSVRLDECDGRRAGAVRFSDDVKRRFDQPAK